MLSVLLRHNYPYREKRVPIGIGTLTDISLCRMFILSPFFALVKRFCETCVKTRYFQSKLSLARINDIVLFGPSRTPVPTENVIHSLMCGFKWLVSLVFSPTMRQCKLSRDRPPGRSAIRDQHSQNENPPQAVACGGWKSIISSQITASCRKALRSRLRSPLPSSRCPRPSRKERRSRS